MTHSRQGGPAFDAHRSGSPLEPVLNGVAQGLAALFPPVEADRSGPERAARSDASESDETASARAPARS